MENKQRGSSGFLNGFVIGLLVGVGIALMITTKKGRKILRSLSEEGLDKVSNLDELMQKFEKVTERATSVPDEDEDLAEEGNDYVPPKKVLLADAAEPAPKKVTLPPIQINTTGDEKKAEAVDVPATLAEAPEEVSEAIAEALEKVVDDLPEDDSMHKVKPTRRRFFRGIPKRG